MEECIFCKMFSGEIETRKVYEDEDVLGVLDIQPRFDRGQCLVIHRRHVEQFYELEDEELARLFRGVKAVASKIKEVFNPPFVSLFSRGVAISMHAHIIVYPSTGEGPMERIMAGFLAAEEIRRISPGELDEIAEKLRGVG